MGKDCSQLSLTQHMKGIDVVGDHVAAGADLQDREAVDVLVGTDHVGRATDIIVDLVWVLPHPIDEGDVVGIE